MVSRSHFEELVIQHRNAAFNLADAEDAMQDAYAQAFRGFYAFAGAGARAWVLAIVRNIAIAPWTTAASPKCGSMWFGFTDATGANETRKTPAA
jgi:DNA-directed RNA polymerase specialized sigma24 family protein